MIENQAAYVQTCLMMGVDLSISCWVQTQSINHPCHAQEDEAPHLAPDAFEALGKMEERNAAIAAEPLDQGSQVEEAGWIRLTYIWHCCHQSKNMLFAYLYIWCQVLRRLNMVRPRRSSESSSSLWFKREVRSGSWWGKSQRSTPRATFCKSSALNPWSYTTYMIIFYMLSSITTNQIWSYDLKPHALRSKRQLEDELQKLDSQYDACNAVMAAGEVGGFSDEWGAKLTPLPFVSHPFQTKQVNWHQLTAREVCEKCHCSHEQSDLYVWVSSHLYSVPSLLLVYIRTDSVQRFANQLYIQPCIDLYIYKSYIYLLYIWAHARGHPVPRTAQVFIGLCSGS